MRIGDQAISDLQAVAVQPPFPGVGEIARALADDLAAYRAMEAILEDFANTRSIDLEALEVLEMRDLGRASDVLSFDAQAVLQQESAIYESLAAIMKARHDAARKTIQNVR